MQFLALENFDEQIFKLIKNKKESADERIMKIIISCILLM